MGCQLTNNFIINKEKNVGNVLYIVEGQKTEINIIIKIFNKVFGYQTYYKKRENSKVRCCALKNNININSKIFIVNSKSSNVTTMEDEDFIESELNCIVKEYPELNIDIKNIQKYFIFDCDRIEDQKYMEKLINKYSNSLDSNDEDYSLGGLLLLNYPSIESFLISNFCVDSFLVKDDLIESGNIKQYNDDMGYIPNKMSKDTIKNAVNELVNALDNMNIKNIDLDNMDRDNLNIYEYETQKNYKYIFSSLIISLIDIGIIKFY